MTLVSEIATFLAGSGKPLTAEEIATELGRSAHDVCYALLSDGRFEARPTWTLMQPRGSSPGSGPAPASLAGPEQHSIRVGSAPSDVFRAGVDARRLYLA